MADHVRDAPFPCTGDTARSIVAEGISTDDGAGRFAASSAGGSPEGIIDPFALKVRDGTDRGAPQA